MVDSITKLVYLEDTYLFESNAKILSTGSDAKGNYLILNETIFYPQGGGQPSDIGVIETDNRTLNVFFVSLVDGKVHHYVKDEVQGIETQSSCRLKIDSDRRLKNAKSHTSGHLLANIVESLAKELVAVKGYHFPEGPYVEFNGKLTSLTSAELIDKVKEIVKEKLESRAGITAREDLENKKLRMVEIDGYEPVPCGGTHLKNLSELKEVFIRKIQTPKETTKISYSFC